MSVYIAQASHDENGKYVGGQPGNQTGTELNTRKYYSDSSKPWKVYRAKDATVARSIASAARGGVANLLIGYAQDSRNSIRTQQKSVGWILANIKKACNCDCTSFDASCINEATLGASDDALFKGGNLMYTGDAHEKIMATGLFSYVGQGVPESELCTGDILVRTGHAVVVISGASPTDSDSPTEPTTTGDASIDELARAVIAGRSGSGDDRKAALGTKYDAVQARVNELLKGTENAAGTSTGTARIIAGEYKVIADKLYVRSTPSRKLDPVDDYSYGQHIYSIQPDVVEAEGYVWAHYKARSGAVRYVAIGTVDGAKKYLAKC